MGVARSCLGAVGVAPPLGLALAGVYALLWHRLEKVI
ncbi:hypothetical protein IW248_001695 [Micromonospora ureilytica]|uniref:Uncharacterized protein n=1 Tax=Micromonospora ureilytica TaxID=709868 RepID=A0ABS0JGE3_9ACTN|nr:hypothetical protein [Micromonospora ureilytica]